MNLKIRGNIPVKKNRQRIGKHGGIYKPAEVDAYEELVGWVARIQKAEPVLGRFTISGVFKIRSTKDLDGVLTTILDSLQRHGLIENDRYLVGITNLTKETIPNKQEEYADITIEPA